MKIELDDTETKVLHQALAAYLSDLREEITKTEKHEWRAALQHEKDILAKIQQRLH